MPKPLGSPGRLLSDRSRFEARARRSVRGVLRAYATGTVDVDAFTADLAAALSKAGLGDASTIEVDVMQTETIDRMTLAAQESQGRIDVSNWRERILSLADNYAAERYNAEVADELEEEGFSLHRWVSLHDGRTRPTHLAADGQTVPLASPYVVGGFPLRYPKDVTGPPSETVNCRCTEVGIREDGDDSTPEAWADNLDQSVPSDSREGEALQQWIDQSDPLVNRTLRHPSRRWGKDSLARAQREQHALDAAFREHGTVMTSSRRFTRRAPDVPPRADEGAVLVDRGYLSVASVSPGRSVTDGDGWTIDVVAPAGTRILRGDASSHEIILPRGLKYRVVKRDTATRYLKLRIMS